MPISSENTSKAEKNVFNFNGLPEELKKLVFSYLDWNDLSQASLMSKEWKRRADEDKQIKIKERERQEKVKIEALVSIIKADAKEAEKLIRVEHNQRLLGLERINQLIEEFRSSDTHKNLVDLYLEIYVDMVDENAPPDPDDDYYCSDDFEDATNENNNVSRPY